VKVYRKDFGSTDYLYAFSVPVGTFGGGAFVSMPGRGTLSYQPDTVETLSLEATRYGPDAYAEPVPTGTAVISANGRLHVGGEGWFAVSEQGEPLRFRSVLAVKNGIPVSRSSVRGDLPGERVQGYAAVAGSALAASTVVMWTTSATYLIGGYDGYSLGQPTRLAQVGCIAPRSIRAYKDLVYWLDDRRQIRRLAFSSYGPEAFQAISRSRVDDRTKGMSLADAALAVGGSADDGFYLFGRWAGRTLADSALYWDENVNGFVEDRVTVGVADSARSIGRVVFQAHDGTVRVHADAAGTGTVNVAVQTGDISSSPWPAVFFGRVGVLCTAQPIGVQGTVKRTGRSGVDDDSVISLEPHTNGGYAWAWDYRQDSVNGPQVPSGLRDVAASILFEAAMTCGSRVVGLVVELEDAGVGAE
jgi:hypothetical protein